MNSVDLKAAMHLIQIWNLSLLTCMLKCILDIVGLHKRSNFTPKLTYYYPYYLFFGGLLVKVKNQVYNRLRCFPQFFFSPHHLQVKYLVLDKSIAVSGQIPFFGRSSSDFPLNFLVQSQVWWVAVTIPVFLSLPKSKHHHHSDCLQHQVFWLWRSEPIPRFSRSISDFRLCHPKQKIRILLVLLWST